MKNTINAKEILKNKFWILEEKGQKIATISFDNEQYLLSNSDGHQFFDTADNMSKKLGSKISWSNLAITERTEKDVQGYPCNSIPYNTMFDVKRKLPLFTKSEKSKSLYCAGYYIIKFDKGWVKSFCPKLITVERYETRGPFKTEFEMKQELSRVNKSS